MPVIVRKNRNLSKYRQRGNNIILSDAPDTPSPRDIAQQYAIDTPVVMMLQEIGEADGWDGRPFWWIIVVAPKNVKKQYTLQNYLPRELVNR